MFFGATAMTNFLANAQIGTNYGNHLYFDLMQFSRTFQPDAKFARFVAGGMVPFGVLRLPAGYELTVFTYPEFYTAANGTATKYLNDLYAVVGCSGARCDRYFGPPERLPLTAIDQAKLMERFGWNPAVPPLPPNIREGAGAIIQPQMFYADGYESENAKAVTVRIQGAPVFPTTMTDCFYTILNAGGTG